MTTEQPNSVSLLLSIGQGIGILLVLLFSYYGLNYIFKGNPIYSFSLAFFIILGLFLLVTAMVAIKRRGIYTGFHNGFTLMEGVALFFYTTIAILAFFVMAHFINIELLLKDEIKTYGQQRLAQLDEMFVSYEDTVGRTLNNIERRIEKTIRNYSQSDDFRKFQDSLSNFNIKITPGAGKGAAIEDARTKLGNTLTTDREGALDGLDDLKKDTEGFIEEKDRILRNWERKYLHSALLEIEEKLISNAEALEIMFKAPAERRHWNAYTFTYSKPQRGENLMTNPNALIDKYEPSWFLPALLALIIHCFILMPYLALKRGGREIDLPRKRKIDEPQRGIRM
ncbi:MAG: hypothetical protein ACKV1O_05700 [Saprospiraceae bacterium]